MKSKDSMKYRIDLEARSDIYQVNLNLNDVNDVRVIAYNYIAENSTVMDVGCACGDFGALLKAKDCNMYGMEYDSGSISLAEDTHAYKTVHQVNLNDFEKDKYDQYVGYFDTIAFLDVLEHLINPEDALMYFMGLLKDDGQLIVSLPNISFCDIKIGLLQNNFAYADTGILDRTHLKFYTHKSIADMMTSLGLEIVNCKPKVNYFSAGRSSLPRSIKRYIKNDPHSFIYQYVCQVKKSSKPTIELRKHNEGETDLGWGSVSTELNKIKKVKFIQTLLPQNSLRYKFVKKIKNMKAGV